ncbi:MAG: fibronectin type III domain-containing protein [Anaerovoracaceae bacterium]
MKKKKTRALLCVCIIFVMLSTTSLCFADASNGYYTVHDCVGAYSLDGNPITYSIPDDCSIMFSYDGINWGGESSYNIEYYPKLGNYPVYFRILQQKEPYNEYKGTVQVNLSKKKVYTKFIDYDFQYGHDPKTMDWSVDVIDYDTNKVINHIWSGEGDVPYFDIKNSYIVTNVTANSLPGYYEAKVVLKEKPNSCYQVVRNDPSSIMVVGDISNRVSASPYKGDYDSNYHSIKVSAPSGAKIYYATTPITDANTSTTNPSFKEPGKYTVYYCVTADFASKYVYGSETVTIAPTGVRNVKASLYKDYNRLKVAWDGVNNVSGYEIWHRTNYQPNFSILGTSTTNYFYTDNLLKNTKYSFRVVPYVLVGSEKIYANNFPTSDFVTTLYKPSSPRISKKTKSSVNVYWRNMNEISGYEISKSSSRYGTFVVDNKSKFTTRATLKVKKNRNYYYKIRAYSEVDDEIIYSPWSNTKKFKLK